MCLQLSLKIYHDVNWNAVNTSTVGPLKFRRNNKVVGLSKEITGLALVTAMATRKLW